MKLINAAKKAAIKIVYIVSKLNICFIIARSACTVNSMIKPKPNDKATQGGLQRHIRQSGSLLVGKPLS